jgi:predicted CoA-substrate-specific enzyme activase
LIVAGVDIGSLSTKSVIMEDEEILASDIILTGPDGTETGLKVLNLALENASLSLDKIEYIVSTGFGRINFPIAQRQITEISCHALGNHWLFPEVRTILDMGGQDCKAIRCDEHGRVANFAMNEKCAAGTGRYLERVAAMFRLSLDEVGPLSLQTIDGPMLVSSYCVVFAERDIQLLIRQGKHRNDILAGAYEAIADRIHSLLARVGIQEAFSISGGVAKNVGVVKRLEKKIGIKAHIAHEPQIVGALGAALYARNLLQKSQDRFYPKTREWMARSKPLDE